MNGSIWGEKMSLYSYSMTVPLIYNTYDIRSDDKESEQIWGLDHSIEWAETNDVAEPLPQKSYVYRTTESINYKISCGHMSDMDDMPQNHYVLSATGILCHNEAEAYDKISRAVEKSCRALSLMMNIRNAVNKAGFQARVQADIDAIKYDHMLYEPYDQLTREPELKEYIDENGRYVVELGVVSVISIREDVHITLYGNLISDSFQRYYKACEEGTSAFLIEELYTALGTENINSKFYHLFSIIQFVEKEFIDRSNAQYMFNADKIKEILSKIEPLLPSNKNEKKKVKDRLKDNLGQLTDIGRSEKLANILLSMGIHEYTGSNGQIAVERENLQLLINLRNHNFHGGGSGNKGKKKGLAIEEAVVQLLSICEKIIEYIVDTNIS